MTREEELISRISLVSTPKGMSVAGVDQSTESTDKAQAHQGPAFSSHNLTKPWFDEGVTYSGILPMSYDMSPKHFQHRLASSAPNWQGIFTSIIKPLLLNKIEETLYLSSSYELLKNAQNYSHKLNIYLSSSLEMACSKR
jgi:hypothetical protein